MEQSDVISVFAGPLERLELPYMIVGAVGAMAYGEMRFTMDIDVAFVEQHVARLGLGESWTAARNWK